MDVTIHIAWHKLCKGPKQTAEVEENEMKCHESKSRSIRHAIFLAALGMTMLTATAPHAADTTACEPKSHGTAFRLSLLSTLGPPVIAAPMVPSSGENVASLGIFVLTGMTVGPGMGHLYAGNTGRFLLGAGIRSVAYAVAAGATVSSTYSGDASAFAFGASPALALALASTVYDIATTGKSVDKYNDKHGLSRVTLSPTYLAEQDAPGIVVAWHF